MIDATLGTGGDDEFDDVPDMGNDPDLSAFGKKLPTDIDSIVKKAIDEHERELAKTRREQRLALKREHQDETRNRRIQSKLDKRAATDRRLGIRASAVSQRIQSYSIASSLGFAGYVAASIVDQFVIRPKEQADIAAEEKYNAEYAAYQQALEQDQVDRRRAREDEISGMSVDQAGIRSKIIGDLPNADRGRLKGAPTQKYLDRLHDELANPNITAQHRRFNEDKIAEVMNSMGVPVPEELSSRNNKAAATQQASNTVQSTFNAVKPIAPKAAVSFLETAGPYGLAIAAGVTGLQALNQGIAAGGDVIGKLGKSAFTGTPTAALKDIANAGRSMIDPLGVNPQLQVAVTGFEILLSLTESIKNYAEKDKEFSPFTLRASVEGDIARLMQSIELAQKNDPLKALFTRSYTQFDLAWNELRSQLFRTLGPAVIGALNILTASLQTTADITPAIYQIGKHSGIAYYLIATLLETIAGNTAPPPAAKDSLFKELADFMDPSNFNDLPGRAFNKNKMPNMVP